MLSFDSIPAEPEKAQRLDQMMALLGCNEDGELTAKYVEGIEDAVERAFSLAPRARSV